MNSAAVLMCWNIPRISEDLLYELFSNAGPIEEISFAKNGKSCFVLYEHADAVHTAKDIFKDVQLDGRPLRMFDQEEIAKIHAQQEEQIAYHDNAPPPSFNSRSYEGPHHLQDRPYSNYNRSASEYHGSDRYSESSRRPHGGVTASNLREVDTERRDWRANSMRGPPMTHYGSSSSAQGRPDLMPSTSSQPKTRGFDANSSVQELMSSSSSILDELMNPYNMPVSRNARDQFPSRAQRDYHEPSADFHGNFVPGRYSRNAHEEFDRSGNEARHSQRNKYESTHFGHHREHPYRQHQADGEQYARGAKFTNSSSSGANYKSKNHYAGERDHKYREQQRSRRH